MIQQDRIGPTAEGNGVVTCRTGGAQSYIWEAVVVSLSGGGVARSG